MSDEAVTGEETKPAAQVEVDGDPTVTIDYGGAAYLFPAVIDDAPGDVIDAIDDQKISYALRGLLGDEQWARFKTTAPKMRDYAGLLDAYLVTTGLKSAGN